MASGTNEFPEDGKPGDDAAMVRRYLGGDAAALEALYLKYQPLLFRVLGARGAKPEDAEEAVSRVWARCVTNEQTGSLLEKYNGECPLPSWLSTVTTNQWYDIVRRKNTVEVEVRPSPDGEQDPFENRPGPPPPSADGDLAKLLHECLEQAFGESEPADLIMLHLVYLHELTQREVGRLWGWHETKISRRLTDALEKIQRATLQRLKQADPRVQLGWEDFLELCQTYQIGLRRPGP